LIYLVAAPVVGGLLAGWDRRISARMQSRQGPPSGSRSMTCRNYGRSKTCRPPLAEFLHRVLPVMVIFTGALFFGGSDLLLVIFA